MSVFVLTCKSLDVWPWRLFYKSTQQVLVCKILILITHFYPHRNTHILGNCYDHQMRLYACKSISSFKKINSTVIFVIILYIFFWIIENLKLISIQKLEEKRQGKEKKIFKCFQCIGIEFHMLLRYCE